VGFHTVWIVDDDGVTSNSTLGRVESRRGYIGGGDSAGWR